MAQLLDKATLRGCSLHILILCVGLQAERKAREAGEELPAEGLFDSNCITPGTPFMVRLHEHLRFFVRHKIASDPLWQRLRVVYSGYDVPGEGEHKIMEFIRIQVCSALAHRGKIPFLYFLNRLIIDRHRCR